MAITAADVNKLRQMTGAGMMDCKQALTENDGDFEKAIDSLRKKGQKLAAKRADRDANEGMVLAAASADNTFASIVMLSSETDFVAKNEEFVNFAKKISILTIEQKPQNQEAALAMQMADGRTVADHITDMVGKIGEKIEMARYECIQAPRVFSYNHHGNRLATIVGFSGPVGKEEVGQDVAMQIAAMSPVGVDQSDVPADIIEREMEIGKDQARAEGKPEEMVEKIAMGKLNKFYKENTLLNQEFIKDNKLTVVQYIKQNAGDVTVTGFKRLMLGA